MSKRIVCLTCLSTFDLNGIKWADSRGAWADPRPVRNQSVWGRWSQRMSGSATPEPSMADVVEWEAQGYEPQCPLGHVLPLEVAQRDSIVIGLVGEIGSSKSHYLASLVVGLVEGDLLAKVGMDAGLAPESRQTFASDYQGRLFGQQQHRVLAATSVITTEEQAASRRPIILVVRDAGTRRETNVIFYDASGEQLNSATAVAKYNRFLYAADALFFFVPPVTLPGIRSQIHTQDQYQQSLLQTKGMIDGLELQLRTARGNDHENHPIAASVLLCKADQCQGIDGFDDDLLLEPDYGTESIAATMARIQDESKKVYSFITQAKGAQLVLGVESRFPGTTFHAVSATGCDPEDGVYPHLTPSRCADPLLATLVRCGVISVEPGASSAPVWD